MLRRNGCTLYSRDLRIVAPPSSARHCFYSRTVVTRILDQAINLSSWQSVILTICHVDISISVLASSRLQPVTYLLLCQYLCRLFLSDYRSSVSRRSLVFKASLLHPPHPVLNISPFRSSDKLSVVQRLFFLEYLTYKPCLSTCLNIILSSVSPLPHSLSFCECLCVCTVSESPSVRPSICPCVRPSVAWLSICLSVRPLVWLSVRPHICLFVCQNPNI